MTARLDLLLPDQVAMGTDVTEPRLVLRPAPDAEWLAARSGPTLDDSARALLGRHDTVVFAGVVEDGRTVAIGRGVVDDGWLGIASIEVAAEARRQGLARAVMDGLWRWGRDRGATRSYLQVETDNEPAVTLYRALGYGVHHDYRYRIEPVS